MHFFLPIMLFFYAHNLLRLCSYLCYSIVFYLWLEDIEADSDLIAFEGRGELLEVMEKTGCDIPLMVSDILYNYTLCTYNIQHKNGVCVCV